MFIKEVFQYYSNIFKLIHNNVIIIKLNVNLYTSRIKLTILK